MYDFSAEVWRVVPSFPQYLASSLGRVMLVPFEGVMPHGGPRVYGGEPNFGVLSEGRYQVNIKGRTVRVHRMVCEAFSGTAPDDASVVMHLDEDSTNNRASNLKWGTQKDNLAAPGFLAYCRRKTGPRAKITREQAHTIKYGSGSCASMAREFGISPATVSNIRAGRSWRHI